MVNTSALNNMSEFSFNTTIINNSNDVASSVVQNANTGSDGYIGLIILILLYLWLNYLLIKPDGLFQYDIVKANVIASGFVSIIGFVMIVSNLIGNFQHVMWFVVLFAFFVVSSYFLKKKNL